VGGHAIVIVGWGIEKNPITLKSNGKIIQTTPYWVCRNSWGESWGDKGYFKIAMYQIVDGFQVNPLTALEKYKTENGQNYGGIILFKPSNKFSKYVGEYQQGNKDNYFYQSENSPENFTYLPSISPSLSPTKAPSSQMIEIPPQPSPPPVRGRNSYTIEEKNAMDAMTNNDNKGTYFTTRNIIIAVSVLFLLILLFS